jgi:ABC-type oligopeptide transport system ATPase subunit
MHVRLNAAADAQDSEVIERAESTPEYTPPPEHDGSDDVHVEDVQIRAVDKLDRLVADDFPFDESQLRAIYGVANQRFACLIGAAGTGKTTSTKKAVDLIKDSLGEVDMKNYWGKRSPDESAADPDDNYEMPDDAIPSICLVGFTGRSTQMIKKNFPRSWHGNIMTIHRMLGFMPEYYEEFDDESSDVKKKMRFAPTYTSTFRLPWDVIIIDEAGMVALDLWELVIAAAKNGVRIIMIGDINQLPPVHGRSIFGFAMTEWPTYELTHIHRQVGANNAIVDAAHSILKGQLPRSDGPGNLTLEGANPAQVKENVFAALSYAIKNPDWKYLQIKVPEDDRTASQRIRRFIELLNTRLYSVESDTVVTPTNGYEESARGYYLGQSYMNRELALKLNPDAPRFIIDAGRERRFFAIGDKVMATKNDHSAGITNGMTGIITNIARNAEYLGEHQRFGITTEVAAWVASMDVEDDPDSVSIEDIANLQDSIEDQNEVKREGRDRGPASHIVTVRFGEGSHAVEMAFDSLSEVGSLMTAYVVTCHKMQGGESPLVMPIMHTAQKSMLNREWAYTAVTRASQRCIVFYTELGFKVALNKQEIKGANLAEKVSFFRRLASAKAGDYRLPNSEPIKNQIAVPDHVGTEVATFKDSAGLTISKTPGLDLAAMLGAKRKPAAKPAPIHVHIHVTQDAQEPRATIDGGYLTPAAPASVEPAAIAAPLKTLAWHEEHNCEPISTRWFYEKYPDLVMPRKPPPMLTHKPAPAPVPAPAVVKLPFKFGVKK